MWNNWNSHNPGENAKCYSHCGKQLTIWQQFQTFQHFNKFKHSLNISHSIPTPKSNENLFHTKHSSQMLIVALSKTAKTENNQNLPLLPKKQTNCGTPTQWYTSQQHEGTISKCNNMDESQIHYAKRTKRDSKGYILYDSIHKVFWKRQNCREEQISGYQGLKSRGRFQYRENLRSLFSNLFLFLNGRLSTQWLKRESWWAQKNLPDSIIQKQYCSSKSINYRRTQSRRGNISPEMRRFLVGSWKLLGRLWAKTISPWLPFWLKDILSCLHQSFHSEAHSRILVHCNTSVC